MKLETLTSRRRKETLHACGPCGMQEPELGSFSLDSSEPLEASAAPITEPPDLQMHPILEHWECNSDGSITGRVYGKLGWEEGIQMTTSIVPAETHYATYVITVSGSIYRLGEKLPGVGQTNTRNADAQLLIPAALPAASAQPRTSGRAKCAPLEFWKGERPIYAASPTGLTLQGVIRYTCSDEAALPASTQKARGASRPAQRGSSPEKASEKEAASICASKDDSQRAAAKAAAATAAARAQSRAREEAARAATTAAEARAAAAEAKARTARAELEATRARAAEAAAAAAAAAAAMDAAQREAAAAATATEEARREVEAAQREAAAVLPPKSVRRRAWSKPSVVVAFDHVMDVDHDSPATMDCSPWPISPLASAGRLTGSVAKAALVAKAQVEAERVWSALGTALCGWGGCTKPARHPGLCVSVPDSRREEEPVRMYTAEPTPSPRELIRQARMEGRLSPSKNPKLGDRVRGKYQGQMGGHNWFDGVVTAVHEDGTCDLHYDDGDYEERVAPRFIKVIAKAETEEREEAEESEVKEVEEIVVGEEPSEMQGTDGADLGVPTLGTDGANLGAAGVPKQPRQRKALPEGASHRPRIKPEEVRAIAAAQGLELVPSSRNETGFRGVTKQKGKYRADIRENDVHRHIRGTFATPEEAALCYARHIGAKRAAAEAAEARVAVPQPLTADETRAAAAAARAAAVAEGLELVPSSSNETGFKGVVKRDKSYEARKKEKGKQRHLGTFATPEEAALCYARHIGAKRAAAEAAEARVAVPQPLTAGEARAAAAAEGLELVPSSITKTGFKYVHPNPVGKFAAFVWDHDKTLHLGTFVTAEEAALHYARYVGAERAAAEAAEARVTAPQPLTADEARAAAAAEGLELVPSSRSNSVAGFKGVRMHSQSHFSVPFTEENGEKKRHLGTFRTPEAAALCYTRHIGAKRAAAEAAEARVAVPQPHTADEARAAAAAEGLELAEAHLGWCVLHSALPDDRRKLQDSPSSSAPPQTSPAAATERASRKRLAAAVACAEVVLQGSVDKARAAAAAEGLELVPSLSNETGFKGVSKSYGRYDARIRENGKQRHLGIFATPEEAALCYARHIGAERAAEEAAEATKKPQPLTADEARAAAAAEGLELVPSSSNETGFKGVVKHYGKYATRIRLNHHHSSLGTFATPEEASLILARYVRDLVDGWLIPGRRPPHHPPRQAPTSALPTPSEFEQAEALRCWRLLLLAMRDDRRKQQDSSSLSAPPPPPSPAGATGHTSRKRPAAAVAYAEVDSQRAMTLKPQLTAERSDDPRAAHCIICLEALDLSVASAGSRGEAACGHTPCCGNYYHKRCLSQWLQGSGQSGITVSTEPKCPTCRRDLVARALIPGPYTKAIEKDMAEEEPGRNHGGS